MPSLPEKPFMSDEEVELFARWIPEQCTALEFGCGGSTLFFFEHGVKKLTSVELDPEWAEKVRSDERLRSYAEAGRFQLIVPEIGPIQKNNWSRPELPARIEWLRYHADSWSKIECKNINFILIDGRFRVACALQSIIHCKQKP